MLPYRFLYSILGLLVCGFLATHSCASLKGVGKIRFTDLKYTQLNEYKVNTTSNHAIIAIAFQPNCNWCDKQIRQLESLIDEYANVQVVLIGINANKRALSREIRKFKTHFPAIYLSDASMRQLGKIDTSPVNLFFDKQGLMLDSYRGFLNEEKMRMALGVLGR